MSILWALPLKGPAHSGVRFAPCFAPLRALHAPNAPPSPPRRAIGAIIYFLLKLQNFGINFQKSLQFFFILTLLNIDNQLIKSFQQTLID
jgi:hypothetical protein